MREDVRTFAEVLRREVCGDTALPAAILPRMSHNDDPLAEYRRALRSQQEIQRALGGLASGRSAIEALRSDALRDALSATATLGQFSSTSAIGEAARGGLFTHQIKGALEAASRGILPGSALASLKAASDLGFGSAAQAALAASRGTALGSFYTGGAVAEALKSMKTLSGTGGVLAGLVRDGATTSAMRQIQAALGATGAMLSIGAMGVPTPDTFPRAARWSLEQSVVGGALAAIARDQALSARSTSALLNGATRTAADSWRTVMDGVIGTSLAGLRPSMVAEYAGLHRSALSIAIRGSDFGLPRKDGAIAGHLADQFEQMRSEMSEFLPSLSSVLEASRQVGSPVHDTGSDRGIAAAAEQLEAAMAEVARTGTLDTLLRFLDNALSTFVANTRREAGDIGALTLLPLLVALFQLAIWLQPAWTPQPDATSPPGIERVHQEQHALSGKFDDLTAMLARHEADNLGSIPRAQVRRPARVRTGPSTASPMTWRLEAGNVVGVRDRENGWVLVFYRDPLSGVVGSGWVYAGLLDER